MDEKTLATIETFDPVHHVNRVEHAFLIATGEICSTSNCG
ncbi:hypothetical protein PAMC26577_38730 [Caballeronia sordidicola]|uniref:Uncharacterized protein n=1 Tax=Caballeronia sordidicola TaxID=196367 RepID=A0A242M3Q5_CABSO|nr:hypothetical protein PAMC26577_38730 [Caballeronia sordidicola]